MAERNLSIRLSVADYSKVNAELSEIGEKGERSKKLRLGSRQTRSCGFACRGSALDRWVWVRASVFMDQGVLLICARAKLMNLPSSDFHACRRTVKRLC